MDDHEAAIRSEIDTAHSDLVATLARFHGEDWLRLSPNEGWTAKDTLAHLATIEERLRGQIEWIVDGTALPTEDVDTFNERKVSERRGWSVEQLRAELDQERQKTFALLGRMQAADFERSAEHPRRGHITVSGVCSQLADHLRRHTADIAAALPAVN